MSWASLVIWLCQLKPCHNVLQEDADLDTLLSELKLTPEGAQVCTSDEAAAEHWLMLVPLRQHQNFDVSLQACKFIWNVVGSSWTADPGQLGLEGYCQANQIRHAIHTAVGKVLCCRKERMLLAVA